MSNCCDIESAALQKKQVLKAVLIINAAMFIAQISAALFAHSTSLLADSLDMLGDAITYGISLYAVKRGGDWVIKASRFKAYIIFILSIIVILEAASKIFLLEVFPKPMIMILFSLLGLIANGVCFYLLSQHRNKDINMRSTWICARNDIVGNIMVLLTAGLILFTHSRWPDIVVGLGFAALLIYSAFGILSDAKSRE